MPTLRESSLLSYMAVKSSIHTCMGGHSSWRQITSPSRWSAHKAHRAKDLCVLKVKEKGQMFWNKQGTGPLKWTTGTVTEILECGCLYMVQGPNSRVYRWNRAHLKPICYNGSSFQDHSVKKEKKQPKNNSFQDHQPSKAKSVSFENGASYMDTRSILFDEPDLPQTPPTSPPKCYSPRSPSCSP